MTRTLVDNTHAQSVWISSKCATIGNCMGLYIKIDILLLTDVFEKFREAYYKTYGLDPANSLTTSPPFPSGPNRW